MHGRRVADAVAEAAWTGAPVTSLCSSPVVSDMCPVDAMQPVPARGEEMHTLLCHNSCGSAPRGAQRRLLVLPRDNAGGGVGFPDRPIRIAGLQASKINSPDKKATRLGEWCTMSLSKGVSFLVYALGWHS